MARLQEVMLPLLLLGAMLLFGVYHLSAQAVVSTHRERAADQQEVLLTQAAGALGAAWDSDETLCPVLAGLQRVVAIQVLLPGGGAPCGATAAESVGGMPPAVLRPALAGTPVRLAVPHSGQPGLQVQAQPVRQGERVVAVAWHVVTMPTGATLLPPLRIGFAGAGAVLLLGGLWVFYRQHRHTSYGLGRLQGELNRLAGTQGQPQDLGQDNPFAAFSMSMGRAIVALHGQIDQLRWQLNEQAAVLTSMAEGVIAVDPEGRVLNINPAAAAILRINSGGARGRHLIEVVRHAELERFVSAVLEQQDMLEGELELHEQPPVLLLLRGTVLRDAQGRQLGALVVLNDVTRLRRLENLRRDFAANVSHELKTPLTTVRGFVETLLDGAIDEPEHARRFLDIVMRHVDRLSAIIDDLLDLAKIEETSTHEQLQTAQVLLRDVLQTVVQMCTHQAASRAVTLELDCPPTLMARLNAPLMEQAVVNLVDNAIKYSPEGSRVRISAATGDGALRVAVQDWGPGIDREHLPRLFERFYRVDKARSRAGGGTGLGLAIVKHIAQAHGGSVEAESLPGKGSTFTISLPQG